jgi:hypothetical protein
MKALIRFQLKMSTWNRIQSAGELQVTSELCVNKYDSYQTVKIRYCGFYMFHITCSSLLVTSGLKKVNRSFSLSQQ